MYTRRLRCYHNFHVRNIKFCFRGFFNLVIFWAELLKNKCNYVRWQKVNTWPCVGNSIILVHFKNVRNFCTNRLTQFHYNLHVTVNITVAVKLKIVCKSHPLGAKKRHLKRWPEGIQNYMNYTIRNILNHRNKLAIA